MAKIYLITGFNNWGKTHLIQGIFNKKKFFGGCPSVFSGKNFCVVPQSNDDLGQAGYITAYQNRINALGGNGHHVTHVVSAFCPTREPKNDSLAIIQQLFNNDQVFLIPIEYKWCGHAKLQLKEIANYFAPVTNLQIHPISQPNPSLVLQDLRKLLPPLL
ncbi:hypothetical protein [Aquaspirillum serpens]|uniref:hypothetical protein n=1 Tax=Aquaspirillum serpens TaxID=190 RepID=UPI0003B71AF6|nr:hypothetical protein [Aquaspirillum serpens]